MERPNARYTKAVDFIVTYINSRSRMVCWESMTRFLVFTLQRIDKRPDTGYRRVLLTASKGGPILKPTWIMTDLAYADELAIKMTNSSSLKWPQSWTWCPNIFVFPSVLKNQGRNQ